MIPAGVGLVVWAIGCAIVSDYPSAQERAAFEKECLPATLKSLEHTKSIELLWPEFVEPAKSDYSVMIRFPFAPKHIEEKMLALEKTRLPVYVGITAEQLIVQASLYGHTITLRQAEDPRDRDPILYVVEGSAVGIIDQYGEFPLERETAMTALNTAQLV